MKNKIEFVLLSKSESKHWLPSELEDGDHMVFVGKNGTVDGEVWRIVVNGDGCFYINAAGSSKKLTPVDQAFAKPDTQTGGWRRTKPVTKYVEY